MFIMFLYSIVRADIAVRFGRPKDENLVARKVGEIPFGIYAGPNYLASTYPENYDWISVEVGEYMVKNSKS